MINDRIDGFAASNAQQEIILASTVHATMNKL